MILFIKGELVVETEDGFRIQPRFIELLKQVQKHGSLNIAVKEMNMSYSYAWNTFFKINCQLSSPLLITHRGGKGGGLAEITDTGKKLIAQYDKLKEDFKLFLDEHSVDLS